MNIGSHISAAGDMTLAPERAAAVGCECFQFFSRPPQGGQGKLITPELAERFRNNLKKNKQQACYIHAPYYINFASADERIYQSSIKIIREELERGSLLGVRALMIHTGSAKELGKAKGLKRAIAGLADVMKGYKGSTRLLIEIAAGAGAVIGDTFAEVGEIIGHKSLKKYNLGVCFDTAHAFASGYDLRNAKAIEKTFAEFDKLVGIENLVVIHSNDSKVALGERKDRHEQLGVGEIGKAGFKALTELAARHNIDMILETPDMNLYAGEIKMLKKWRDSVKK